MAGRKIGIYSGAFDPIHAGHVAFAEQAGASVLLDHIFILPEPVSRSHQKVAPLPDRLAMVRLAIAEAPGLSILEPPAGQFSIARTLPWLQQQFTGDALFFLIGSDVVATFAYRWPGLEMLLQQVHVVIGLRHDDRRADVEDQLYAMYLELAIQPHFTVLDVPKPTLSATHIRQGRHVINDLHPQVATYIQEYSLYV